MTDNETIQDNAVAMTIRENINISELKTVVENFSIKTLEQQEIAVHSICVYLTTVNSTECLNYCENWLKNNLSNIFSIKATCTVLEFISHMLVAKDVNLTNLVFSLCPVTYEDRLVWIQIERILILSLNKEVVNFCTLFLELAQKFSKEILNLSKNTRVFSDLYSYLEKSDISFVIGKLCFSFDTNCRALGLFLFDRVGVQKFPEELWSDLNPDNYQLSYYEFQRRELSGKATAYYLINMIPHLSNMNQDFNDEFLNELTLQAKNYKVCFDIFESESKNFILLNQVVDNVKNYFAKLNSISKASVNSMQVHGYKRAKEIHDRKISNYKQDVLKKHSLFLQIAQYHPMLYGRALRIYSDGRFNGPSNFQPLAVLLEKDEDAPRMHYIDPESMAIRISNANIKIIQLSITQKE